MLAVLVPAALSACAASGDVGRHAEIRAFSRNAQFCGQAGTPICEARLNRVDGRAVFSGDTVRVESGRRRLGIFCRMNLSIMIGDAQTFQREIVADLAAGGRYRIDARMSPEPCSITLAEEPR